jgi:hypothetical protein
MSLHDSLLAKAFCGGAGGGADIDVTAEVGQTIIVKEVDENGKPTKWKSADYQPRTHWSEWKEVVPTRQITPQYDSSLSAPTAGLPTFEIMSGAKYKTTFDGVEYACTAFSGALNGMDFVAFGNQAVIGGENTGEPFAVVYVGYCFIITFDMNPHTVQVFAETATQIPQKYLANAFPYYVEVYRESTSGTPSNDFSCSETQANLEAIYNSGRLVVLRLETYDTLNKTRMWSYYQLSSVFLPKDLPILIISFVHPIGNSGNGQSALIFMPNEGGTYDISEDFGN